MGALKNVRRAGMDQIMEDDWVEPTDEEEEENPEDENFVKRRIKKCFGRQEKSWPDFSERSSVVSDFIRGAVVTTNSAS